VSDFTVVDKGELSDYREYLVSQGVGAGVATGCFAFGVTVLPKCSLRLRLSSLSSLGTYL